MGKIIKSANIPDSSYLLAQTPKNFSDKNYWLKELQDKVNADWAYQPNRVDIELEQNIGEEDYIPIEAIIETVKNEKGKEFSDDFRKLLFKNFEKKYALGSRFRFSYSFNLEEPNAQKNIWIVTNRSAASPESEVVITRCNGTIGSAEIDERNIAYNHYEPIYQTSTLQSPIFSYNEVVVSAQSAFYGIVQHNKHTKKYYINQRFIIGYDQVYRIKAISKSYSNTTYNPTDIGYMVIYFEKIESAEKDNFETRIAYNKEQGVKIDNSDNENNYTIKINTPQIIPVNLPDEELQFEAFLYKNEEKINKTIQVQCILDGALNPNNYFTYKQIDSNHFSLQRIRFFTKSNLVVKCYINAANSPTGQEIYISFSLGLNGI